MISKLTYEKDLYIACLDLEDKIYIKQVEVIGSEGNSYILSEKLTGIKAISAMHWDTVCKSVGKKTIPMRAVGDNWERGYIFYEYIDAFKRLENYNDKQESKVLKQLEIVATNKARLENLRG